MAVGLRHANPAQLFARDLVNGQELVSCSAKWELKQVLKLMVKEQIRRMPVINAEYQVVGIITLSDIANFAGTGRKKTDVSLTEFVESVRGIAGSHHKLTDLVEPSAE